MSDTLTAYNSFGKLNIVTEASSTIPQMVFDLIDTSEDDKSWHGDRISFSYTSGNINTNGCLGANHFRITENAYYAGDKVNFDLIGDGNVLYNSMSDNDLNITYTGVKGTSNNLFIYSDRNRLDLSAQHNSFINSHDNKLDTFNLSGMNFINSNGNSFQKYITDNKEIISANDMSFYKSDNNIIRGQTTSANGVTFINSNNNYYASDDTPNSQKVLINSNNCFIYNTDAKDRNIVSIGNDYGWIENSNNIIAIGKGLYCNNRTNKIILGQFNKNPEEKDILVVGDGSLSQNEYNNLSSVYKTVYENGFTDDDINSYNIDYKNKLYSNRHNIFTVNSDGYIKINGANNTLNPSLQYYAKYSFSGITFTQKNPQGTAVVERDIPFEDLYDSLKENINVRKEYQNKLDAISAHIDNISNNIPSYFIVELQSSDSTVTVDDLATRVGAATDTDAAANKTILLVQNNTGEAKIVKYGSTDSEQVTINNLYATEFISYNNAWLVVG